MTTFAIDFKWQPAGQVTIGEDDRLVFPSMAEAPRIYSFLIDRAGEPPQMYVGEAANARKRMQFYRSPGPGMPTNLRIRDLLIEAVTSASTLLWRPSRVPRLVSMAAHPRMSTSSARTRG